MPIETLEEVRIDRLDVADEPQVHALAVRPAGGTAGEPIRSESLPSAAERAGGAGGPSETRSDRLAVRPNVGKWDACHDVRRRVSAGPPAPPARWIGGDWVATVSN